ncbi:MAG: ferrous iron transporter B [Clostridia bacterium]|nr:ferrous iron transporter B [Clostridia bacterium]
MRTFALAGNPNCGKTTLFNALTGSTAHVGNWPGVTVDKKEGVYKGGSEKVNIVDLPGIYSLSPYTPEEVIARNFILDEAPDGIINIVDATNLERNLYLTTQLLEMDVPVIIALNMMDEVEKKGDKIDVKELEDKIGVPVVSICALKNNGIKELMERAVSMPETRKGKTIVQGNISGAIEKAESFYAAKEVTSPTFHAMKLLENDELEVDKKENANLLAEISAEYGEDLEAVIADERYKYISAHFTVAKKKSTDKAVLTKSDKIDKVLTHKIWSIPIFLVILFAIFHLTFSENLLYLNGFGDGWMLSLEDLGIEGGLATFVGIFYDGTVYSPGVILFNVMDVITSLIGDGLSLALESAPDWANGLVVDAVWGGIAAVLSFVPQILVLFAFFSILEDTGYMARVAFILDRIFRRFGLSGRAFMPMIMGFGCSIPAMINTRTLADDKERTATIRVIPFFSCGAKLPILTAVAGTLCGSAYLDTAISIGMGAETLTYLMYLVGIIVAIVAVIFMRNTSMKGATPPFIMELPAYHAPGFKNLCLHVWDKLKHYVKKAFTIIFVSTVIIWFLSSFDWSWTWTDDIGSSILGSIGKLIQPIFTPLGFGSQLGKEAGWVFAVAAITGLIAKENVIATFGALAVAVGKAVEGIESEDGIEEVATMINAIRESNPGLTDLQIVAAMISFIVFNMTTIPCFAACATARAELPKGKFKWTVLFWLATSYIASCVIYTSIAWAWCIPIWLVLFAGIGVLIYFNNKGKLEKVKFWKNLKKNKA